MSGEPTPAPKAPRWWLRILLSLMAFFLLVFVGIAVAAYRWGNRPENREKLGAMPDLMKIGLESATAPGTAELRALGCSNAVVMDGARLNDLTERLQRLSGEGDAGAATMQAQVVTLYCGVAKGRALGCDQVARTYAEAAPTAPGPYLVVVQEDRGRAGPLCQGVYDRAGQLLEAVAEDAE